MSETLRSGRVKCPECQRKGVGFAGHPHASGYKDHDRARCRFCRCEFKTVPIPDSLSYTVGKLTYKPDETKS